MIYQHLLDEIYYAGTNPRIEELMNPLENLKRISNGRMMNSGLMTTTYHTGEEHMTPEMKVATGQIPGGALIKEAPGGDSHRTTMT